MSSLLPPHWLKRANAGPSPSKNILKRSRNEAHRNVTGFSPIKKKNKGVVKFSNSTPSRPPFPTSKSTSTKISFFDVLPEDEVMDLDEREGNAEDSEEGYEDDEEEYGEGDEEEYEKGDEADEGVRKGFLRWRLTKNEFEANLEKKPLVTMTHNTPLYC